MKRLKVHAGLEFIDGKQHRIVIAVNSKSQLARILDVGIYIVNNWWGETGNKKEIELATNKPYTKIDMGAI